MRRQALVPFFLCALAVLAVEALPSIQIQSGGEEAAWKWATGALRASTVPSMQDPGSSALEAFWRNNTRNEDGGESEGLRVRWSNVLNLPSKWGHKKSYDKSGLAINGHFVNTTSRLAQLRQAMKEKNIQAYIVSTYDDHQSEYIAERDMRRKFISGFSGSNGDAVITKNAAALWTDSRYYLQAEQQLDSNWLLMKDGTSGVPTLLEWLSTQLPKGSNVSVDPRTIPYTSWKSWSDTFDALDFNGVILDENLIDPIWDKEGNRPLYPNVSLWVHDIKFAGETWRSKAGRLRTHMLSKDVSVMVVTSLDEIAWALNLRGGDIPYTPVFRSYLVVGTDWITLYIPEDKITSLVKQHLSDGDQNVKIKKYEEVWNDLPTIGNSAQKVLLTSPYSYSRGVSLSVYKSLPPEKIVFDVSPLLIMKETKNTNEIKGMHTAHVKDAVALCQMLRILENGVAAGEKWDELKVVQKLDSLRSQQNESYGASFGTISAFGSNAALPHYQPDETTNKIIDKSNVYLVDSGGQYSGGTTDVTRTIHLGKPKKFHKKAYTNLLKGCIDLATVIFPEGQTMNQLEILLRAPLYSMGINYGHGSTHGIGSFLGVHESFNTTYHLGFFGSQEPGVYKEGDFGIRLENIVTVVYANKSYEGKDFFKFETVTLIPYEKKLIDLKLISDHQLNWLNRYHSRVLKVVGEEMLYQGLKEDYEWLVNKTVPLTKCNKKKKKQNIKKMFTFFQRK